MLAAKCQVPSWFLVWIKLVQKTDKKPNLDGFSTTGQNKRTVQQQAAESPSTLVFRTTNSNRRTQYKREPLPPMPRLHARKDGGWPRAPDQGSLLQLVEIET